MDAPTQERIRRDTERLQEANRMMLAANAALARHDDAALLQMGFSREHIADLRRQGGFPLRAITENRRTVAYLRRFVNAHKGST